MPVFTISKKENKMLSCWESEIAQRLSSGKLEDRLIRGAQGASLQAYNMLFVRARPPMRTTLIDMETKSTDDVEFLWRLRPKNPDVALGEIFFSYLGATVHTIRCNTALDSAFDRILEFAALQKVFGLPPIGAAYYALVRERFEQAALSGDLYFAVPNIINCLSSKRLSETYPDSKNLTHETRAYVYSSLCRFQHLVWQRDGSAAGA